jgi:hypothetical protein
MKDLYYKVLQHKATIPTAIGVASFAAGYATCHILNRRKTVGDFYSGELHEEYVRHTPVTVTDTEYDHIVSDPEWTDEDITVNDVIGYVTTITQDEEGITVEGEVEEAIVNTFKNNDDDWDMEAELERRTDEAPYILHVEEFVNDELGFSQSTLTYYEGDDILTDEKDVPIYDKTNVVGDLRFGYGSGDPNVVYIRCPKLRAEFEVLRDQGSYAFEVLGVDVEQSLKHSAHTPLRMRSWED